MDILEDKFNQIKELAEIYYKSVESVKCPYFNGERVYFNTGGFEHISFKKRDKPRARKDQYNRFRLLPLAVSTIKKSGTIQEYEERKLWISHKPKKGSNKTLKLVKYYIFISVINNLRLKVVIREIKGSQKNFWSVYPTWKKIKYVNGEEKRKLFSGEPETD